MEVTNEQYKEREGKEKILTEFGPQSKMYVERRLPEVSEIEKSRKVGDNEKLEANKSREEILCCEEKN